MSDTKRYRVCECVGVRLPYGRSCHDCGHGDCAPGVVDAGVVWQSEVPTKGTWFAWHPTSPRYVHSDVVASEFGVRLGGVSHDASRLSDGLWRFAPRTIPAPPKE